MAKTLSLQTFQAVAVAFAAAAAMLMLDEVAASLAAVPFAPVQSDAVAEKARVAAMEEFPNVTIETVAGTHTSFAGTGGHVRVATMFYSHCPGVCPMTIDTLRGIERQLTTRQRAKLGFVLLSLDPTRDSPETLRALAKERGITSPRWLLGRTSEADARAFAAASNIQYRTLSDGTIDHSSALVLLDERGRVLARKAGEGDSTEFVASVRQALDRTGVR